MLARMAFVDMRTNGLWPAILLPLTEITLVALPETPNVVLGPPIVVLPPCIWMPPPLGKFVMTLLLIEPFVIAAPVEAEPKVKRRMAEPFDCAASTLLVSVLPEMSTLLIVPL